MSQKPPFKVSEQIPVILPKICNALNCEQNMKNSAFCDGEFGVSFEESIRGSQVYLVQSTFPNSDNLMEFLLMIDAAKRASEIDNRRSALFRVGRGKIKR